PDLPDPDLIIRTSGELRLSNFLLWQAAYSELVFVPTYWPDFDRAALEDAIAEYHRRERRFGGLIAQTGSWRGSGAIGQARQLHPDIECRPKQLNPAHRLIAGARAACDCGRLFRRPSLRAVLGHRGARRSLGMADPGLRPRPQSRADDRRCCA